MRPSNSRRSRRAQRILEAQAAREAARAACDAALAERARADAAKQAAMALAEIEQRSIEARPRLIPRGTPGLRYPDDEILEIVRNLALIQCTVVEAGLVFGVTGAAFRQWLDQHPAAKTAWETGRGEGLVLLRQAQWAAAQEGNPALLVWLGKQYLDQQDRLQHTGDSTQPIVVQWQVQRAE